MRRQSDDESQGHEPTIRSIAGRHKAQESLTVDDVLRGHREMAKDMNFASLIKWQAIDVDAAWTIVKIQPGVSERGHEAAVHTIAQGLILQQLGYLDEARASFLRLLRELGIASDSSTPKRLHDLLKPDTADAAIVLQFRLDESPLDTDAYRQNLELAMSSLKHNMNKAKFYWRRFLQAGVAGKPVDPREIADGYADLVGEEWAAASGNAASVAIYATLSRAARERPDRSARHWDEALSLANQVTRGTRSRLLSVDAQHPHLMMHSVLAGLNLVTQIRARIAHLRGKRGDVSELGEIRDAIALLRRNAGIRGNADGFRELAQVNKVLFKESASILHLPPRPSRLERGKDAAGMLGLLSLCEIVENL